MAVPLGVTTAVRQVATTGQLPVATTVLPQAVMMERRLAVMMAVRQVEMMGQLPVMMTERRLGTMMVLPLVTTMAQRLGTMMEQPRVMMTELLQVMTMGQRQEMTTELRQGTLQALRILQNLQAVERRQKPRRLRQSSLLRRVLVPDQRRLRLRVRSLLIRPRLLRVVP